MADVKIFEYSLPETVAKYQEYYGSVVHKKLKIGVGLDGSEVVKKAMQTVKRMVNLDRGDSLSGLHVEDPKKHDMTPTLKPDFIRRQFERMTYPIRPNHLHWFSLKKGEEHSYAQLAKMAEDHSIDLLVVGNIGHTQSKVGDTDKKTLGHIAESTWRLCQSNICVVKSTSYELQVDRPATYLVSTDGSHASMMAFCFVVFRLMRPDDELIVQYYGTSDEVSEEHKVLMLKSYEEVLKDKKINGRVEGVVMDETGAIPETILQQCSKVQADFLVIGLSGYKHEKLGSVSRDVLGAARCSVIAVKVRPQGTTVSC